MIDPAIVLDFRCTHAPLNVSRSQFVRVGQARRPQDFQETLDRVALKVEDARGLARNAKTAHPVRVLRGYADRTVIGIAFKRLDTTQRKHHRSGGVAQICTDGHALNHIESGHDLAATDYADFFSQIAPEQRIVCEEKPIRKRHAN